MPLPRAVVPGRAPLICMANTWHLCLLGPVEGRYGDAPDAPALPRPRTRRSLALLAYLALRPDGAHPRELLADLFWPDASPVNGRASLRTALSDVRGMLEGPGRAPAGSALRTEGNTHVSLRADAVSTDIARINAAAALARGGTALSATDRALLNDASRLVERGALLEGLEDAAPRDWLSSERGTLADAAHAIRSRLDAAPSEGGGSDDGEGGERARRAAGASRFAVGSASGSEGGAVALRERPSPLVVTGPAPADVRLPRPASRFFGREDELTALRALLGGRDAARLVTLTGPGGSGKTRLAVEAARTLASEFPNGVCFVPLADLVDPARIPDAVLSALGQTPDPRQGGMEQAAAALRGGSGGRSLLVLDNLEHLLPGADEAALGLLSRVPTLSILATSRRALQVEGEREAPVSPLPAPPREVASGAQMVRAERLMGFASVRLFTDRARAARPDFQVTQRSAPDVAALCHRLDGMPLALELAATWAHVLSPGQMLTRLDSDGGARGLLTASRRRDLGDRHGALHDTLRWSHDLLPEGARLLIAPLSVFRGGWTLDAAEAVCGSGPDVLDALATLSAHSFVATHEDAVGRMRYRMLEPVREFAADLLEARCADEADAVRRRHFDWVMALTAEAGNHLRGGPGQAASLARLEAEQDNLRAALDRALALGRLEDALILVGRLWPFWERSAHLREGRDRADALLALADAADALPTAEGVRARARIGAGNLCRGLGDYPAAEAYLRAALASARASGDAAIEAAATSNLASVLLARGDHDDALPLYERAVTLAHEAGEKPVEAASLINLATLALKKCEYDRAEECGRRALALYRALGDRVREAVVLGNLSMVAIWRGDHIGSLSPLTEALAIQRELGDRQGEAHVRDYLSIAVCWAGAPGPARALCERASALHAEVGNADGGAYSLGCQSVARRFAGDWDGAGEMGRRLCERAGAMGALLSVASGRALQAMAALGAGRYAHAEALAGRAMLAYREGGYPAGVADCHLVIGIAAAERGESETAHGHFREAARLARGTGALGAAAEALFETAAVFTDAGDSAAALAVLREARTEASATRAPVKIARALDETATALAERALPGDHENAARLWAAADALRDRAGRSTEWDPLAWDDPAAAPPPAERPAQAPSHYDRRHRHARRGAAVRAALGAAEYARAAAEGASLPLDEALALTDRG